MAYARQRSSIAQIFLLVAVLSGPRPLITASQLEAEHKDDVRDLCIDDVRSFAVCMLCYHRTNQKIQNCCQSMNVYNECLDNISELIKNLSNDLGTPKSWIDLADSLTLVPVEIPMQQLPEAGFQQLTPVSMASPGHMLANKRSLEEIRKDLEPLLEDGDNGRDWEDYELDQLEEMIKRRSPFLGKRRSPFLGKRRSPFLGKRRSPFLGKRRSPFLGKRRSPFLGKRDDLGDAEDLRVFSIENEKRGRSPFLG